MEATVQVRKRGTLTLPVELREKYGITEGDTFRIVDVDGTFVLTPMAPIVPELAREIALNSPQSPARESRSNKATHPTPRA